METILIYRKYHNKKITIGGLIFDSKKEAVRYKELKMLEKAGIIHDVQRQVKYVLIPAQYELTSKVYVKGNNKGKPKKGKLIERECAYYADFVYTENSKTVVEDTKGVKTPEYIIKRKLMLYVHNIKIKEM